MRAPALVLMASLVAAPLSAQAATSLPAPVVLSMVPNPESFVVVPAQAGDSIPIEVILDTGAGLDVLAPSVIRKLHGTPAGVFTGFRMTGERLDIPLFVVPRLTVGPFTRTDVVVGTWDVLDSLGIDAIISAVGFREQPVTMDFAARTVTFETPQSLAERRAAGQVAPLLLADDRNRSLDLFAEFLIGGQRGQCELDTGSNGIRANTRYLAPLGIDTTAREVTRRSRRTVTGDVEAQYIAAAPRVSLDAAPEIAIENPSVTFSNIIYDCVIGRGYWEGRALTLDIANRQMVVGPGAAAHAQDAVRGADPVPTHETFTIMSRVLGEARPINVHTPSGYDASSGARFPVLYMPDGGIHEDFPHVVNTVDSLIALGEMQPVIVVGIPNTERRRDLTGPTRYAADSAIAARVGGSAAFRRFIRDELMPEVSARYRTTGERAIVGESLAGLFILETFLLEPGLFDHYIALDPSLWWDGGALVDSAPARLAALDTAPRTLYLASSNVDEIADATARLAAELRAAQPARLVWEYLPRPDLTHATIFRAVAPAALASGL